MKVMEKYKKYARLFFAYIIISHLFVFFAIIAGGFSPELREMDAGVSFFVIHTIFIYINKRILYVRQTRDNNFGLSAEEATEYHTPHWGFQLFGTIKSFIGIFIYSVFFIAFLELVLNLLRQNNFTFVFIILKLVQLTFPVILIAWDIKRLRFPSLIRKEKIDKNRQEELDYAKKMESYSNRKKRSEELGTITGYEPEELEKIDLISNPLMRGEPGAGLSGSGFSQANIQAGSLGELNFAKALQIKNLLQQFASYWSVQYPFEYIPGPDTTSKGDIDCVLISKKNVYLIDLKLYAQGNITWTTVNNTNEVVAIDNITGNWVGKPRKMSKNMHFATKRIQEKFDKLGIDMKVKPYVVMMPTDRGLGKVDNVFWPGGVECLTLIDFLKILEKEKPFDLYAVEAEVLDSVFTWLTKDESGSAPRYN